MCTICGLPFGGPGEDHLCARCLAQRPYFDRARACTTYRGIEDNPTPITRLLYRFKYGRDVTLAPTLGSLLAKRNLLLESHDLVVPVPLHMDRLRWRGFNQAVLLGRALARRRRLPLDPFAIVRTRPTRTQVGLTDGERRANISGAFAVRKASTVRKRSVLLVDDVYTTGATVNECAKVLRSSGAQRVDVVVLARAVLH